jgi:hypothetical protein
MLTGAGATSTAVKNLSKVAGDATFANAQWTVAEGDEATFVLDVSFTAATGSDNGVYRVVVSEIVGVTVDETSSGLVLVEDGPIVSNVSLPTCSLMLSPATIQSGQKAKLSWLNTNVASGTLRFANGSVLPMTIKNLTGSQVVSPKTTFEYRMSVSNSNGNAVCSRTLAVVPSASTTKSKTDTVKTKVESTGSVLGASTTIYDEIGQTLRNISSMLETIK